MAPPPPAAARPMGARPATSAFGVIALILVGGAVATVIGAIMMYARLYESPTLIGLRQSTAYYALLCALVGLVTAAGIMLTRPRGPVAPIFAVVAGYVALYVGIRIGVLGYAFGHGSVPFRFVTELMKPRFEGWHLLAPFMAGAVAGLRVLMVAGGTAPRPPAGQPFGQPFGQPSGQAFGQPFGQPGGYAQPGAYGPGGQGQPAPRLPAQPPVPGQPAPYQRPPVPGPGQGPHPGPPQGGPRPNGGF
ncbi:hypothetical protein ACFOY4_34035 [Actinomadura syzygii]|uniref:Uncharacterized protein n=1 Tax=Actinomadura syzygii TaxID=1427538 RepID=A0A5D0UPE3_9ACTN|nr:hypothetical protein [Actinomadura syzygii]TYC18909.1 hypothetical protein FXF65_04050 [Actinomadura syzygii]